MRIKTKIILAFALTALAAIIISIGFSVLSLSRRFERIASEDLLTTRRNAEGVFYEMLGDLVRKALFLSELQEVTRNTANPDALYLSLEVKSFLFFNINIRIITPDRRILLTLQNAQQSLIDEANLGRLDFFQPGRDPLLREAGVFAIADRVCLAAVSPIINPDTYALQGFILLESPLNAEFAAQMKERIKSDLIFCSTRMPLASTLTDANGDMIFPSLPAAADTAAIDLPGSGGRYRLARFPIDDIRKQPAGQVWVALNTEKLLASKRLGVINLLFVAALISLLVLLTSVYLGRRLSAPVLALARGAEAIARGQYDIELKVRPGDEIGDLAAVLTRMAESIRRSRQEILELQQFFEKIVEFAPSAIIIGNELGEVIALNPAAAALVRMQQAECRGRPLFEAVAALKPLKEKYVEVMLSGRPFRHEGITVADGEGDEKTLRLVIYKVDLPSSPAGVLQIEDVTETLKLEEKLVHAQKLGTLGELLSRFTHEFNNLMTSLLGHLTMLRRELRDGQPGAARAKLVEEIAVKAQQLGRDILDFSRREKPVVQPVPVDEAVETVLKLLARTVLKRIDVAWHPDGGALRVLINKEKFLLSLFNLLINARDAIAAANPETGRIAIDAERIFISREEKHFVRLRIQDNGTGIDERTLARIFEPYFTTKQDKGTGLGLTTVKEIVEENGGWLEVETEVGNGTTVIVFLPEYVH